MARMFGTDGVRGVAGTELTIELAMKQRNSPTSRQSSLDVIQEFPEECLQMH